MIKSRVNQYKNIFIIKLWVLKNLVYISYIYLVCITCISFFVYDVSTKYNRLIDYLSP